MASNFEDIMAFIQETLEALSGVEKVFRMDKVVKSRKDIVSEFVTSETKESWWMIFRDSNDPEPLDVNGTVLWIHNVTLQGIHRYHDDSAYDSTSQKEFETLIELVQFAFANPWVFSDVANAGHAEPPKLAINEKRIFKAPDERMLHYCEINLRPQEVVET